MMTIPGMEDASLAVREPVGAEPVEFVSEMPVFCAHEHWGSLAAVGMGAYGFRADLEAGAMPELLRLTMFEPNRPKLSEHVFMQVNNPPTPLKTLYSKALRGSKALSSALMCPVSEVV